MTKSELAEKLQKLDSVVLYVETIKKELKETFNDVDFVSILEVVLSASKCMAQALVEQGFISEREVERLLEINE